MANWIDITNYVIDNLPDDIFDYEDLDQGIKVFIPMSSKSHYDNRGNEINCNKLLFIVNRSYSEDTFYIKKMCECCDYVQDELHDLSYKDTIKLIDKYLYTKLDHKSAISMIKNIIYNVPD